MARYRIQLDGYTPISLNRLLGVKVRDRIRRKRADRDAVLLALQRGGVPRVAVPRCQVRAARRSGIDPSNVTVPTPSRPPCRRRLSVEFTPGPERVGGRFAPGGQAPDPDNLLKSLVDAAVDGGFLVDDSAEWLEAAMPAIRPRDPARGPFTVIELEDLG